MKNKQWRDVGLVINRAKEIEGGRAFSKIWKAYEAAAKQDATRLLKQIQENKNGGWLEDYLAWQYMFRYSTKSQETLSAFESLRGEHDVRAVELKKLAGKAFKAKDNDEGYAKYQEIVDKCYASRLYPLASSILKQRR